MLAKRRWSDLSEGQRRALVAVGVAEGLLKLVALIDIRRRPASEIRGPKWAWVSALSVVGSAGVLPVSYFVFGRRR